MSRGRVSHHEPLLVPQQIPCTLCQTDDTEQEADSFVVQPIVLQAEETEVALTGQPQEQGPYNSVPSLPSYDYFSQLMDHGGVANRTVEFVITSGKLSTTVAAAAIFMCSELHTTKTPILPMRMVSPGDKL